MRRAHPDLISGVIFSDSDPVDVEDGRTYERAHIERYIHECHAAGRELESPTKHLPMGLALKAQRCHQGTCRCGTQ